MTEYRTDRRKLEQRQNLERLADAAAELEQVAQDIEICSKAQEAEVRLRTKGLNLIEGEDRDEARKYVNELLQKAKAAVLDKQEKRKQLYQKLGKIGTVSAIVATGLAMVGVPVYFTAKYWNTRDKALEALAKYDQPVKITDPKEREEVISHLDEIFEEHAEDIGSDSATVDYLNFLEINGYAINDGVKMLGITGDGFFPKETADSLGKMTTEYLSFLKAGGYTVSEGVRIFETIKNNHNSAKVNEIIKEYIPKFVSYIKAKNIGIQKGECLLKEFSGASDRLIPDLELISQSGICK